MASPKSAFSTCPPPPHFSLYESKSETYIFCYRNNTATSEPRFAAESKSPRSLVLEVSRVPSELAPAPTPAQTAKVKAFSSAKPAKTAKVDSTKLARIAKDLARMAKDKMAKVSTKLVRQVLDHRSIKPQHLLSEVKGHLVMERPLDLI